MPPRRYRFCSTCANAWVGCAGEMALDLKDAVERNELLKTVLINGKLAVDDEQLAPALGRERGYGRFIPAR